MHKQTIIKHLNIYIYIYKRRGRKHSHSVQQILCELQLAVIAPYSTKFFTERV